LINWAAKVRWNQHWQKLKKDGKNEIT